MKKLKRLPTLRPIPGYPNYFVDERKNIYSTQPRGNHQKEPGRAKRMTPFYVYGTNWPRLVVKIVLPDKRRVFRSVKQLFELAFPESLGDGNETMTSNENKGAKYG